MNKHDYYKQLAKQATHKPITKLTILKWCLLAVLAVLFARWIITGILIALTDGLIWTPLLLIGLVLFIDSDGKGRD